MFEESKVSLRSKLSIIDSVYKRHQLTIQTLSNKDLNSSQETMENSDFGDQLAGLGQVYGQSTSVNIHSDMRRA